ncbi:MAG TPA: hypothetical protein VF656_19800 [Pyrinomonadaceae bacterium]|jgi:hypothetical protein
MKRLVAAMMVVLLTCAVVLSTEKKVRVKFPPGRTTVVLKGVAVGGEDAGISYVLRARKGQRMTVHVSSPQKGRAAFSIYPPGGGPQVVEGGQDVADWDGTLPKSGDYSIHVYPIGDDDSDTAFTLEVTVR